MVVLVLVVVLVMKNDGKEPMRPSIKGESERARDQERFMFLRVCVCVFVHGRTCTLGRFVGGFCPFAFSSCLFVYSCAFFPPPSLHVCVCLVAVLEGGGDFLFVGTVCLFRFPPLFLGVFVR